MSNFSFYFKQLNDDIESIRQGVESISQGIESIPERIESTLEVSINDQK